MTEDFQAADSRRFAEIEAAEQLVPRAPLPPADPQEERAERAGARQVNAWFALSALSVVAFVVLFAVTSAHGTVRTQNAALGSTLGLAMLAAGIAAVTWYKRVMPHRPAVQEREPVASSASERAALEADWVAGTDRSGVTRRKVLLVSMGASTGLLAVPPLVLLRDLGPDPEAGTGRNVLTYTAWTADAKFVELDSDRPVKSGDLAIGSLMTVLPEGHDDAAADSSVMLVRVSPKSIRLDAFERYAERFGRRAEDFVVDGHVAYSKICTHAGCPVSLFERRREQFLCPCHQSTFDVNAAGKVLFGPAARALPLLPFRIDGDGYFRALGDFPEPVGPSFWERG